MATILDTTGPLVQEADVDDAGHRSYRIVFRVRSTDKHDGPALVLQTPGLPLPGSVWFFGNDIDIYAWCRPTRRVRKARGVKENNPVLFWDVECTFSTAPAAPGGGTSSGRPGSGGGKGGGNRKGCHDQRIEDPLLEPQGTSGSFLKRKHLVTHDRHGNAVLNSAWEPPEGDNAEYDEANPTVTIEQNVPNLQLGLCTSMMNTTNDAQLWGLPARTWELVEFDWEQKYHGLCYPYYTRRFKFEAHYRYEFDPVLGVVLLRPNVDRTFRDTATKALKGHWGTGKDTPATSGTGAEGTGWVFESVSDLAFEHPNRLKPGDFTKYRDREGNYAQAVLDGMGKPYDPDDATREFYWVYIVGTTPNVTFGTFAASLLSADPDEGVNALYGPFYTEAQATAAAADSTLFTNSYYRGWDFGFPAPGSYKVEKHTEANFLLLGIPTVL